MSGSRPVAGLWQAILAVVLVVLTGAGLWWAGRAQASPTGSHTATTRVSLGARTFVCPGGTPGSTVASAAGTTTPVHRVSAPTTIRVGAGSAGSSYAVQGDASSRWLAAGACPEPAASWWFVGAGSGPGHDTVLTVANPRPGPAVFDLSVYGAHGPVHAPGLAGLTVPPGGTRVLDLQRLAASTGDLAVHVTAIRGLVAVSAADHWEPGLIGRKVFEWLPVSPAPSRRMLITGLPEKAGRPTLLLANPGSSVRLVHLSVSGPRGRFVPSGQNTISLQPRRVRAVALGPSFRLGAVSVSISADGPVGASVRSVVAGDEAYAVPGETLAGTTVTGTGPTPPRTRAQLMLAAPGASGTARARIFSRSGKMLLARSVRVSAGSTVPLPLPPGSASVSLVPGAGGGVVGALVLVSHSPGVAVLPFVSAERSVRVPVVRPSW